MVPLEGHTEALEFLLEHGVHPNQADRWGGLPLDDAVLASHEEAEALLRKHGGRGGSSEHISSEGPTDPLEHHGDADALRATVAVAGD